MISELITALLEASTGKEPPKEFRIFPMGKFQTKKGEFLFDDEAAKSVLAEYQEHGVELSLDYEHAALQDAPAGAPAAGWYSLELRPDGLYATNVRWTPRAASFLSNAEYRYFSPAFAADPKTGRVKRLVNIALTNLPATRALQPLVAAKDKQPEEGPQETPPMKTLLAALSLKDTATEAEAITALNSITAQHQALEGELMTLTGGKTLSEARGLLASMKAKAERFDKAEAEIVALKAKETEREVLALVDEGVREGKIPPAMKTFWTEQGKKDLAVLKTFVATAPKLVSTTGTTPPAGETDPVVVLTDDDKMFAKQMGISEKDFLATKAKRFSALK